MVTVGELAFAIDSRPFVAGVDRMRVALRGFAKDARDASGAFRPVPGGGGRIPGGGGGGGGRLPAVIPGGLGIPGLGALVGGAAAFAGLRSGIRTIAEFEQSIAKIGGTLGQSGDQLRRFSTLAREVGESTIFSATEVADALLTLTRQGRSFEQQQAAIRPLLQFAQASEQSLGVAAKSASDIATQFQIPFENIGKVTDLVSAAASRSSTDVQEMSRAFADAGSVLSAFGADAEEAATILQILANAGIRGGKAGIAIRNITLRNQEQIDREGVQGFVASLAGKSTAELADLVDTRAVPALINLARGFEDFDRLLEQNRNSVAGFTQQLSGAVDQTVSAAGKRFGSAFEELALSFDDMLGISSNLTGFLDDFSGLVRRGSAAIRAEAAAREQLRRSIETDTTRATVSLGGGRTLSLSSAQLLSLGINSGQQAPSALSEAQQLARGIYPSGSRPTAPGSVAGGPVVPQAPPTVVTGQYGYFERFQDNAASIFARAPANLGPVIEQLEQERRSLQLSGAAREAYNASVAASDNVRTAEIPRIRAMVDELRQLERMDTVFDGVAQGFAAIGDAALFASDNLSEAVENIVRDLSRLTVQQIALQPLADLLRAGIGGAFGGTPRQQGAGGSYVVSGGGGHVAGGGVGG